MPHEAESEEVASLSSSRHPAPFDGRDSLASLHRVPVGGISADPTASQEIAEEDSEDKSLEEFARAMSEGLRAEPKATTPQWIYDDEGSRLFELICKLDEYYPTRTERALLTSSCREIVAPLGRDVSVIEYGSGNAEKTEVLIDELVSSERKVCYIPIDISEHALVEATQRIRRRPGVTVRAVLGDIRAAVEEVARVRSGQGLSLFLGGNIGNYSAEDAHAFLSQVSKASPSGDYFLLGADLVKDKDVLIRAYDDASGVTAAFNKNLLVRINRELGGNFDLDRFEHQAIWNEERSRIEMHLRSTVAQTVEIEALGRSFEFREGETLHTENSRKYTPETLDRLASQSGWVSDERWIDEKGYYSLSRFRMK